MTERWISKRIGFPLYDYLRLDMLSNLSDLKILGHEAHIDDWFDFSFIKLL